MPTYVFKVLKPWKYYEEDFEVDDLVELFMKMSDLDKFKQDNPELERYFDTAPAFTFNGIVKVPMGFTERLKQIDETHGTKMVGDSKMHHSKEW